MVNRQNNEIPRRTMLEFADPAESAPGRIRTCDTGFRRAVLYPLSYEGGRLASLPPTGHHLVDMRFLSGLDNPTRRARPDSCDHVRELPWDSPCESRTQSGCGKPLQ